MISTMATYRNVRTRETVESARQPRPLRLWRLVEPAGDHPAPATTGGVYVEPEPAQPARKATPRKAAAKGQPRAKRTPKGEAK